MFLEYMTVGRIVQQCTVGQKMWLTKDLMKWFPALIAFYVQVV